MTNLREAAQMALNALEKLNQDGWILADFEDEVYASIEALRAALAQPEPVSVSPKEFIAAVTGKLDISGVPVLMSVWPAPEKTQPEQEPVAWYDKHGMITHDPFEGVTPLYTAPPQRGWVGLTFDDVMSLPGFDYDKAQYIAEEKFARAIEAKLKEKNSD